MSDDAMSEALYTHTIVAPSAPEVAAAAGGERGTGEVGLRFEFLLRTPVVVWPDIKPLDAVLSWAAVEESIYRDDADPLSRQHDIGLAWLGTPAGRCAKASAIDLVIERDAHGVPVRYASSYAYIKRQSSQMYSDAWESGLLAKRPPKLDSTRGATVAGLFLQKVIHPDALVAFAVADGVGGVQRVLQLLPYVTNVGKLHRLGLGAVSHVRVSVDGQAQAKWLNRPLPVDLPEHLRSQAELVTGQPLAMAVGALCAPYYDRRQHQAVLRPCGV